jgi:hypothetical protein
MHALILTAIIAAQPDTAAIRVRLDKITLKDAEQLNGRFVVAQLPVAKPSYTWGEGKNLVTVIGTDGPGAAERTAVLRGDRLHDADLGAKVVVMGRLRVIRHPPSVIGGKKFAGFTEIRIEE